MEERWKFTPIDSQEDVDDRIELFGFLCLLQMHLPHHYRRLNQRR
jgi:hypothetical protein